LSAVTTSFWSGRSRKLNISISSRLICVGIALNMTFSIAYIKPYIELTFFVK